MSETKYIGFGDVWQIAEKKKENKEDNSRADQQPKIELEKKIRKGDRHTKNRKHLNVRIDSRLFEKIKILCEDKQLSLQDFIVMATDHYLRSISSHQHSLTGDNPHNIFKTDTAVINLYQKLTGKRWQLADDYECQGLNGATTDEILVGLCQTYLQANGRKINRFKNCLQEIQVIINEHLGPSFVKAILRRHMNQIKKQSKKPSGR